MKPLRLNDIVYIIYFDNYNFNVNGCRVVDLEFECYMDALSRNTLSGGRYVLELNTTLNIAIGENLCYTRKIVVDYVDYIQYLNVVERLIEPEITSPTYRCICDKEFLNKIIENILKGTIDELPIKPPINPQRLLFSSKS